MEAIGTYLPMLVVVLLGATLLYQLLYYLVVVASVVRYARAKRSYNEELPPLSVVVYAKDNGYYLKKLLPLILNQDYPQFELIVVDDNSQDDTKGVLTHLQYIYPNLYVTRVPDSARSISHRKLAITLGIKAAKHDIVVHTTANVLPKSSYWLREIGRNFVPEVDVVIGTSSISHSRSVFSNMADYNQLFSSLQYMSAAALGHPYMGVCDNLAYRKSLFFEVKGFSGHLYLIYGDDDIFINEHAVGSRTRILTSPDATVKAHYHSFSRGWREYKSRYAFTARYLKAGVLSLFAWERVTRVAFYLLLVALPCCFPGGYIISIAAYLLRLAVQYVVLYRASNTVYNRGYIKGLLLYDIADICIDLRFRFMRHERAIRNYTIHLI